MRRFLAFRFTATLLEHCTLFFFLFIDELIINAIVQVSIIVLLIYTILFSALPCKLHNSSGYYHAYDLFWPLEGFGLFQLLLLLLLWIFDKH
jgi:hypothetical protein